MAPRLAPPVPGGVICQLYKPAWNPTHAAIDWCAPKGTPILAVLPGVVISIANTPHGGNNFIVKHDNGVHTYYAHCDRILVRVGQRVKKLQQLATVGATGSPNPGVVTIDPHLHMQVQAEAAFSSTHYNPLDFLDKHGIEAVDRVMYWKAGYPQLELNTATIKTGVSLLAIVGVGAIALWYYLRRKHAV